MPLTPEQVKNRVANLTNEAYEKFMKQVDDAIIADASKNGVERLSASVSTKNISRLVCDKVVDTLRAHGWDARYISDQRDGDFIHVKYKEPSKREISNYQDSWYYGFDR